MLTSPHSAFVQKTNCEVASTLPYGIASINLGPPLLSRAPFDNLGPGPEPPPEGPFLSVEIVAFRINFLISAS